MKKRKTKNVDVDAEASTEPAPATQDSAPDTDADPKPILSMDEVLPSRLSSPTPYPPPIVAAPPPPPRVQEPPAKKLEGWVIKVDGKVVSDVFVVKQLAIVAAKPYLPLGHVSIEPT